MNKAYGLGFLVLALATAGSLHQSAQAADVPQGETLAQTIAAMPKGLARAEGPTLEKSIEAAEAAEKACAAKGAKVSVLVADSVGEPVVILSGDGAGVRSRLITTSKVATVLKFKMPSLDAANRAEKDPAIKKAAAADPDIGELRGGGFPIVKHSHIIGAVAVSGASIFGVPDMDEKCAETAVRVLEAD